MDAQAPGIWSLLALILGGFFLAPFLASFVLTKAVIPLLAKTGLIDRPNDRSSHKRPTPRGGGVVPVLVTLAGWAAYAQWKGILFSQTTWYGGFWPFLACGLALMLLGLADDRRGLSPWLRLAVQAAAMTVTVVLFAPKFVFFAGDLPDWLGRAFVVLIGIWFVNLYNFMDGIDGITGVETISIMLAMVALAFLGVGNRFMMPAQLILAAAMLGFIIHNWHPARVFLGDAGSVPIGYLVFVMLLFAQIGPNAASTPYPLTAIVILPLYYLADSGITLARRVLRRQNPMKAHKEHFYQQAAAAGLAPDEICWRVLGCNAILATLAWVSAGPAGVWAVCLALILTAGFLWLLPQGRLK